MKEDKCPLSLQEQKDLVNTPYNLVKLNFPKYSRSRLIEWRRKLKEQIPHNENITKDKIGELSRQIGEKLVENFKVIKLPIIPIPKLNKIRNEEESILDLSDMHYGMINSIYDTIEGKKITTYNCDIFKIELNNLIKSIYSIHGIQSNAYRLRNLTINCLGDVITNDRIFPEQVFNIEKVVGLQIWDLSVALSYFLLSLSKIYEDITFIGIVGNHGRSNQEFKEEVVENNFEYHLYRILQKEFQDNKRIHIIVPTTRRYLHRVLKWRHLLEHGDNFRGSTENYIKNQVQSLYASIGGFDMLHFGHFHKLGENEIADKVIYKRNGCWIYKDEWAFGKFKEYSIPKQWFFGCNDKRPETWNFKLNLRRI